ncbi:MAG TPA: hypothetical protein VME23_15915 [Terracidiphilus sp.]|nr:hypothetical protein [Terracidiphilus sp.]
MSIRVVDAGAGGASRRQFLIGATAAGLLTSAGRFAFAQEKRGLADLPARPANQPLDFHSLANAFDAYVMDPAHGVILRDKTGRQYFASALETTDEGGLTCYGPMAMGKELRGSGLHELSRSLKAYFSEPYGLFLDGPGATLCEYWYLMNVNALAFALIRTRFAHDPEWTDRVRRSAESLRNMAHQIKYDFNDQGFDYAAGKPFTRQDIYRQPDAVGGYSYVMLLAWEIAGKDFCLDEAKTAIDRYTAFRKNPWYEIPSGAMAVLSSARLESLGHPANPRRCLDFVLDSRIGLMATGKWGSVPVDGLMAGFCTEPAGQAYSMESMVTLPYLMPALRFRPDFAAEVACYALNVAANLRWFYPEYLPRENQSRPDLTPAVPYERLSREAHGRSPFAEGDFAGHRSIYGGAYVMWLDKMIVPQSDPWLLRWDLTLTNFLDRSLPPTFLYYNPWPVKKTILVEGPGHARDLALNRVLPSKSGTTEVVLGAGEARVIEILR